MSKILEGLWQCGGYELLAEAEEVKPDLIVCLARPHHLNTEERTSAWLSNHYIRFAFDDGDALPNMDSLWGVVNQVVNMVKAGGRVIVHCNAGLNRSGLVCAMAVALLTGKSGRQAMEHVRICRNPLALCNRAFENFLVKLS